MALETLPKEYFICNILDLNVDKEIIFSTPVRLKFYSKGRKLYVDNILVNVATMEMTISGKEYGQYTLDLRNLPDEVSYEFDY